MLKSTLAPPPAVRRGESQSPGRGNATILLIAGRGVVLGALSVLAFGAAGSAGVGACPVPSVNHATIQEAIDDIGCSSISLAAQSYPESLLVERSLTIGGLGSADTFIDGRIEVHGSGTDFTLSAVGINNGCTKPGLRILDGARGTTIDTQIEPALLPCPLLVNEVFFDGFESGDTTAWE
ncbi:MAG: hypothetical protein K8J08_20820 [Thermoanaerobaculia bacterium]|nr:hypothetical protein [Thermoanaerobaculia bacterium]